MRLCDLQQASVKSAASLSSSLAYFTINNLIFYLSAKVNGWIVVTCSKEIVPRHPIPIFDEEETHL